LLYCSSKYDCYKERLKNSFLIKIESMWTQRTYGHEQVEGIQWFMGVTMNKWT